MIIYQFTAYKIKNKHLLFFVFFFSLLFSHKLKGIYHSYMNPVKARGENLTGVIKNRNNHKIVVNWANDGSMRKEDIITRTYLTCPACGSKHQAEMPLDACQFFHECPSCHIILRPKGGDCCVFCSYGDRPCPSVQRKQRR